MMREIPLMWKFPGEFRKTGIPPYPAVGSRRNENVACKLIYAMQIYHRLLKQQKYIPVIGTSAAFINEPEVSWSPEKIPHSQ